jgi:hypothetical protein
MDITSNIQKKIMSPPSATAFQKGSVARVVMRMIRKETAPNAASMRFQSN